MELGEENLILAGFDIKFWPLDPVSRLSVDVMKLSYREESGEGSCQTAPLGMSYSHISTLVKCLGACKREVTTDDC